MSGGTLRSDSIPRLAGTNVRARYPEISVGLRALDTLIGGGLPLPALLIVDENKSRVYASVLSKYFIAEGVYNEHAVFLASASRNPEEFLENLPDKTNTPECSRGDAAAAADGVAENMAKMKIAWRYSTVPKMDSSLGASEQSAPQFDLSRKMDATKLKASTIHFFPETVAGTSVDSHRKSVVGTSANRYQEAAEGNLADTYPEGTVPGTRRIPSSYSDLYRRIQQKLTDEQFSATPSKSAKRVLRIIIEGIGSPLWQDPENDIKFVSHLRSLLCSSYAAAMLIMNSSGMTAEHRERLYSYGDLVIELDALDASSTTEKKLSDRFDGYFRLIKLPSIASTATHCPASSDLVFQLLKRKFDIRTLHLPPAFDDHERNGSTREGTYLSCQKMF